MSENGRTNGQFVVTGGTGNLGRRIVERLVESGGRVRVLSRQEMANTDEFEYARGDLATGQGVGNALSGAEVVIHCAGSAKGDDLKAFNLVKAAQNERIKHLVYISVVGADRVPVSSAVDRAMFGYYLAKHEAEKAIANSGIPWSTVRATQFHDLILTSIRGIARVPISPVPKGFRFQPIDAAEVADRMVELAVGPPAGLVTPMGGPNVYSMGDLLRSYLATTNKKRWIVSMKMPGKAAQAMRDGANLAESHRVGVRTWEDFLASELAGTA